MMSCLIFVVGALIEFAIVVLISRSSTSLNKKLEKSNAENTNKQMVSGTPMLCWNQGENINDITENARIGKPRPGLARKLIDKAFPNLNTIDLYAFCLYFGLFVLFNCVYWSKYLTK